MVSLNAKFGYLILNRHEIISWLWTKEEKIKKTEVVVKKQVVMFVINLTI